MASKAHDTIAALIVRSMRFEGFEPVSADVREIVFGDPALPTSRVIGKHRPDLIGYRKGDGRVCVGEAKTRSDIRSQRTKEEIQDFATCDEIDLFIGIPSDGASYLDEVLDALGLRNRPNIRRVVVPKELLS
jgi:hypothetical protein